jgi:hypothetical protein
MMVGDCQFRFEVEVKVKVGVEVEVNVSQCQELSGQNSVRRKDGDPMPCGSVCMYSTF